MDLGYPGGPVIDRLAIDGDPTAIRFPRAMANDGWDFSFSGLKTAVVNHVRKHPNADINDVAASFQEAVADVLVGKARRRPAGRSQGVVPRRRCRRELAAAEKTLDVCVEDGYRAFLPSRAMCTDNAAMWRLRHGGASRLMAPRHSTSGRIPRFGFPSPDSALICSSQGCRSPGRVVSLALGIPEC